MSVDPLLRVSGGVAVHRGSINVGIVRDGTRALLIDCSEEAVAALPALGVTTVERILVTHHHRDQLTGAAQLVARGARLAVPAGERGLVADPCAFWSDPDRRWHRYHFRPGQLMPVEPLAVDAVLNDGDVITWGAARIRVLATPGHTDGSLSFLVETDGRRIAFGGDAIAGPGRVWDLHSLQRGVLGWRDYHGFLGAREMLMTGLQRLAGERPDLLVPSHGEVMDDPAAAIAALDQALAACHQRYAAISALRHYYDALLGADAVREHMTPAPALPMPPCVRQIGTTWVLIAADGAALVMDCGGNHITTGVQALVASGEITRVDALWLTHYHDDHIDGIPGFRSAFAVPCLTVGAVAEVVCEPTAWRLPCLSPVRVVVDRVLADGESWTWHGYRLTAYDFPGQTRHHGGLLAEGEGRRLFFVGDSFTPSGIDDYCLQNRISFVAGRGFPRCLDLLQRLRPTHLFNSHVGVPFTFTDAQYDAMRCNLALRLRELAALTPWEHPDYALDDAWVRCHPYEQVAAPGATVRIAVVVENHAPQAQATTCTAVLPWAGCARPSASATIPPGTEGRLALDIPIPAGLAPGHHPIAIDIRHGARDLPRFAEAVIVVAAETRAG